MEIVQYTVLQGGLQYLYFQVIASDVTNFTGEYMKPSLPLQLCGVSSRTLFEGIGLIEYYFYPDDHSVPNVWIKAYYMPGCKVTNYSSTMSLSCVRWQLCTYGNHSISFFIECNTHTSSMDSIKT